jgi:hypothetical protein
VVRVVATRRRCRGARAGLAVPVRARRLQRHVLDLNPREVPVSSHARIPSDLTPQPRDVARNTESFKLR